MPDVVLLSYRSVNVVTVDVCPADSFSFIAIAITSELFWIVVTDAIAVEVVIPE